MDCRYKQWLFWCVIGAVWNHLVWKLSAFSCTLFRAAKQLRLSFVVLRMFSGFREIRFNLRPVLINTGGYVYIHIYIYICMCIHFGSFVTHVFCQASTLQELPLYRSAQGLSLTILDHGRDSGCWSWIRSGRTPEQNQRD